MKKIFYFNYCATKWTTGLFSVFQVTAKGFFVNIAMKKNIFPILIFGAVVIFFILWKNFHSGHLAPYRIGVVSFTAVDKVTFAGFKDGLNHLGYGEHGGQPVEYLFLSADGDPAKLPDNIEKVMDFQPELIFVSSTPATLAVQKATREKSIPVVFGPVNDPVAAGIVKSLKQPSGHITGIRLSPSDARRLQLFHQVSPSSRQLYLPYHPDDESAMASRQQVLDEAKKLGIKIISKELLNEENMTEALQVLPEGVDGIFLPRDSRVEARIKAWVTLSLTKKIPLCAPSRQQTEHGALFSYGFSHSQIGEQAARLASQIIQGAHPGTLPVEAAENFSFLNIKTAKAIDLSLPDETLRQINEIIRK